MQSLRAQDAAALLQLLDEQAALFEKWLEIDQRKRRALIERDRAQIEATVVEQSNILLKLEAAEQKRLEVMHDRLRVSARMTLRELTGLLPAELRDRWIQTADRLQELVVRVQESNALSDTLLRQALAHNQVLLDAMLGKQSVATTYSASGTAPAAGAAVTPAPARRINEQA